MYILYFMIKPQRSQMLVEKDNFILKTVSNMILNSGPWLKRCFILLIYLWKSLTPLNPTRAQKWPRNIKRLKSGHANLEEWYSITATVWQSFSNRRSKPIVAIITDRISFTTTVMANATLGINAMLFSVPNFHHLNEQFWLTHGYHSR